MATVHALTRTRPGTPLADCAAEAAAQALAAAAPPLTEAQRELLRTLLGDARPQRRTTQQRRAA